MNVLVHIANKMGLQKELSSSKWKADGLYTELK
jgi:hypothetical protein